MKDGVTSVVLWDNDGVLVETEGHYFRATREVLQERGVVLTEAAFRQYFLVESTGIQALLPGLPRTELESLRAKRNAIYRELLGTEPIEVPGAAEVLEALYGRVLMGVVTTRCASTSTSSTRAPGSRVTSASCWRAATTRARSRTPLPISPRSRPAPPSARHRAIAWSSRIRCGASARPRLPGSAAG